METRDVDLKTRLISDQVTHFAAGFVRFQILNNKERGVSAGSGTLVSVGSVHGILTAAHVLEALPRNGEVGIALNYEDPSQFRRLVIEMQHAEPILIGGEASGASGPDLGFLRLSQSDVGKLKALGSFYNLSRRRSDALANVPSASNYVDAITGIVHERTKEIASVSPKVVSTGFEALFVDGLSGKIIDHADFDLFDFEPAPRPGFILPSDYRGVSGGAVWRFYVNLEGETPKVVEKRLLGVPFHQSDLKDGNRVLRCHGPRSVYATLFDKI